MRGGNFKMSGTSIICNNIANGTSGYYWGGGVCMNNGTFNMSGMSVIKDNTLTDGTTKNSVYLYAGKKITLVGDLSNACVYITAASAPCTVTADFSSCCAGKSPYSYIFADDDDTYKIGVDSDGEVCLSENDG